MNQWSLTHESSFSRSAWFYGRIFLSGEDADALDTIWRNGSELDQMGSNELDLMISIRCTLWDALDRRLRGDKRLMIVWWFWIRFKTFAELLAATRPLTEWWTCEVWSASHPLQRFTGDHNLCHYGWGSMKIDSRKSIHESRCVNRSSHVGSSLSQWELVWLQNLPASCDFQFSKFRPDFQMDTLS